MANTLGYQTGPPDPPSLVLDQTISGRIFRPMSTVFTKQLADAGINVADDRPSTGLTPFLKSAAQDQWDIFRGPITAFCAGPDPDFTFMNDKLRPAGGDAPRRPNWFAQFFTGTAEIPAVRERRGLKSSSVSTAGSPAE